MARNNEIDRTLDEFVSEHQDGWSHDDWTQLLNSLAARGHEVSDPDTLGLELERRRVLDFLARSGVQGLGPKRREAIADRYPRLWDLRNATIDEIAATPTIPPSVAAALGTRLD